MSTAQERAARILTTFNHLVVASEFPVKIGEIVNPIYLGERLDQPCRIVRETTRSDFQAQCALLREGTPWKGWRYFYLVETD